MATAIETKRYTPEDLLHLPDGDRYELVNGQLVEKEMSTWASYVTGKVIRKLGDFCEGHGLGWVLPDGTSYQCFSDAPTKVRKPDTSFIRRERMSLEEATSEGHLSISPDLAVEVLSPNDLAYEVETKVQEYLRAGVRLVWVVNPEAKTVAIHRPHKQGTILYENDELEGEDVLPGFSCPVRELFAPPPGVTQARI